jgi:hypothetical protein
MPWERYISKKTFKGGVPMRDKVSVRKDGFSISRNLYNEHLNKPDKPFIEVYVNRDTGEIGLRASKTGHKPLRRKPTTCATIYAKGILAEWKPVTGRYPARYDAAADLVVFKPTLEVQLEQPPEALEEEPPTPSIPNPTRKVCPGGLEHPLEDLDICRSRCEYYKRKYGDSPESCKWDGWDEDVPEDNG